MARLALRYNKLESACELTAVEKNILALEVLGVSYEQVEASLKKKPNGQLAEYETLNSSMKFLCSRRPSLGVMEDPPFTCARAMEVPREKYTVIFFGC